jgi:chaperonin cofactor prefoldin
MKTRNGFVSNSSSSSFVIAVPTKTKKCKCCHRSDAVFLQLLVKYITTLTKDGNKLYTMVDANQVDEFYRQELDDLVKSKEHLKQQLTTVTELLVDDQAVSTYLKIKKQMDLLVWKPELQREDPGMLKVTNELKERKERIEKHLAEYDAKVKDIKEKIAKLKKFLNDKWRVYSFTIDNWCTEPERVIKEMIADKRIVEVIDSVYT